LLKRTELDYKQLEEIDTERGELTFAEAEQVEIQLKYEGYIKLQLEQIEEFKKIEKKKIPVDIDYNDVKGIRIEARQKLDKQRPESIGQASRISGVSPSDISVLLIYLNMEGKD
jgi:tRNA uridine 5-carboxymethylaminomethyl modification enzyme